MSETHEVDVVVVGLGPGGEAVASGAAEAGLEVVGIDRRLVGGECPYYGCIPSKMMLEAAHRLQTAGSIQGVAGSADVHPDFTPVATRIRDEATTDWDDASAVERLTGAGITFVRGEARLTGPKQVEVDGTTYAARVGVVLNVGTQPATPSIPGLADTPFWTNQEVVKVTEVPASLIVVGGGPIGVEMAQAFAGFGCRVTLLEGGDRILGPDEPEASQALAGVLAEQGVQVLDGVQIERVDHADGSFTVTTTSGGQTQELTADKLLVAAGRITQLQGLGLETVGVDPEAHRLDVDERCRVVGAEGLWAVGDVTGKGAYTHVSMYQSAIVVPDLQGEDGPTGDYRAVPHVTYTDPEVAGVGMTEQAARDAGLTVNVGSYDLGASTRGWIAGASGLVKLVEDADRGVLVGGTVVGPAAGEIVAMLTVAVHAEVPVERLLSMMYAFPALHRAVENAVKDLRA
ncbi:NAD(P)/FAD-dependent oxidoreductase [Nocardioidaceae bacterium]|nr:NAD(P)/FAD-dependent oxidoreductase [Nocardioidaceae bacterium]